MLVNIIFSHGLLDIHNTYYRKYFSAKSSELVTSSASSSLGLWVPASNSIELDELEYERRIKRAQKLGHGALFDKCKLLGWLPLPGQWSPVPASPAPPSCGVCPGPPQPPPPRPPQTRRPTCWPGLEAPSALRPSSGRTRPSCPPHS